MTVFRSMGPLWQRDSYTCTKASTVHALDKYLLNRRLNFLKELYYSFNIVRMERWYYFHIFKKGTTILFQYQRRVPPQWCSTFSGSLSNSMETTLKFYAEQFLSVLHLSSIIIFRTIGDMKNAYICVKVVSFDEVNMVPIANGISRSKRIQRVCIPRFLSWSSTTTADIMKMLPTLPPTAIEANKRSLATLDHADDRVTGEISRSLSRGFSALSILISDSRPIIPAKVLVAPV